MKKNAVVCSDNNRIVAVHHTKMSIRMFNLKSNINSSVVYQIMLFDKHIVTNATKYIYGDFYSNTFCEKFDLKMLYK